MRAQQGMESHLAKRGWARLPVLNRWLREWLHRQQFSGSQHLLRRLLWWQPQSLQPCQRPDPGHQCVAREPDGSVLGRSHRAGAVDLPDRVLTHRPRRALHWYPEGLEDHERGSDVGANKPGSHQGRSRDSGSLRRSPNQGPDRCGDVRHGVCHCTVIPRR